jgi:DNA-binding transcriptional LysR family regulator
MELRHLTYFVAVAERLNFSRAAEELHVAQPAISQQIHALEHELGAPLFERIGRRVQLTDAGHALLPHARQILSAVEAARNEVRERGQLLKGTAKLGTPPTVSAHILPDRLTAFEQKYPGLDVTLREAGTDTLLKLVEQGELDLAIVSTDLLPSSVECAPFLEENYVVAVGGHHRLCHRECAAMVEFAEDAFILFPEGYKLREVTLNACRNAGFEPKIALDGGGIQSTLQFVAAGLGVAIVPELALAEAADICPIKIEDQNLRRTLGLVWRKGQYLSPAARALREFLLK